MTALLTNALVYRAIAEEALAESARLEAAARQPKPDGSPGFVIQMDPERKSFKKSLVAIAFSGIYLEALLFVHGTFQIGTDWEKKFDRKSYEEKMKALGIKDEALLAAAKRLREVRKELVHEKARPLETAALSKNYWAQTEASASVTLVQGHSGQAHECGLTPRSSGAPTAGHQARSGGTRYIFASPGWRPAVVARLARTLGLANRHCALRQRNQRLSAWAEQPRRGKAAKEGVTAARQAARTSRARTDGKADILQAVQR